jgi:hypothetical protein
MNSNKFELDTPTILYAGRFPLLAAALLGFAWVLHISLGYFSEPVIVFLQAFCGGFYVETLIKRGRAINLLYAAINGGVLASVVMLVYFLAYWLANIIRDQDFSFYGISYLISVLVAGFIGALGALAWYAIKNNINR